MGMQKCIDLGVYYDIVKFINNHAEWHERSGSMTARQPFPKGANARIHEVDMTNGKLRPHCKVRFFIFKPRSPPRPKYKFRNG